ncbi:hypothetical protein TorRG33x02_007640 [Trema orientale]|uniref:Uncharacterized protein n=1 Tax=Trema orientale TaxID=63057 RepID=A0A2P5G0L6_TREOI|nr:hypothetical protein TorRG33x02_007640 [Trema orientale]
MISGTQKDLLVHQVLLCGATLSIYFFRYLAGGFSKSVQMWVMDVNNNSDIGGCRYTWRKYARTEPLEGLIRSPLTFWNSDEFLISTEDRGIVSYNLRTQKTRNVYKCKGIISSGPYVKSLVSIKGGEDD